MKFFLVLISLVIAVLVEWSLTRILSWWIAPLLVVATLIFWLSRLEWSSRLWVSGILGFFMDSIYSQPFGTYLVVFLLLSLLLQPLKLLFWNTKSYFTQGIIGAILILLFLIVTPLISSLIEFLS